MTDLPAPLGYPGPVACAAAGITYRRLDYWARTDLVVPSVRPAAGSGTQRLYSEEDIVQLATIRHLLNAGLSLPGVRAAMLKLFDSFTLRLERVTLDVDVDGIRADVAHVLAVVEPTAGLRPTSLQLVRADA